MAVLKRKNERIAAAFLASLQIKNDQQWEDMVKYAESLADYLDEGQSEYEPLFDFVIKLINQYEETTNKQSEVTGQQMLRFLMDQNDHKLLDLSDIAPKSVWSEILNGKRRLNKRHIEKLSEKYSVSPAVFFDG